MLTKYPNVALNQSSPPKAAWSCGEWMKSPAYKKRILSTSSWLNAPP